jgi:hypothetical protein
MMKLFLQLDLRHWQKADYEKPMLAFASSFSSDVIGAELDNQSEAYIVDLVVKLCTQAQQVFVLVNAQPEEPIGAVLKLLNHLLRNENQIHTLVLRGNHQQTERLLQTIGEKFKREDDPKKIKEWIKGFATGNLPG